MSSARPPLTWLRPLLRWVLAASWVLHSCIPCSVLAKWRVTWVWSEKCEWGKSNPNPKPATENLYYHSDLHVGFWKRSSFQRGAQTCEIQWWIDLQQCQALLLLWVTISPQMIFILGKRLSEVISQLVAQLQMSSDWKTLPSLQRTGNKAPNSSTFCIYKKLLFQQV